MRVTIMSRAYGRPNGEQDRQVTVHGEVAWRVEGVQCTPLGVGDPERVVQLRAGGEITQTRGGFDVVDDRSRSVERLLVSAVPVNGRAALFAEEPGDSDPERRGERLQPVDGGSLEPTLVLANQRLGDTDLVGELDLREPALLAGGSEACGIHEIDCDGRCCLR